MPYTSWKMLMLGLQLKFTFCHKLCAINGVCDDALKVSLVKI